MNVGQIREAVKRRLNMNASQLDDSIDPAGWLDFINEAYSDTWKLVRNTAPRECTVESVDFTWPAGANTYTLPTELKNATIYQIIQVNAQGVPCGSFWGFFEKRNVLRLPPGSPVGGLTFRIYFIPEAEELTGDTSVPQLIPPQHHDVIMWECLNTVKALFDKEVPERWESTLEDLKFLLCKEFMARPINDRARIRLPDAPLIRPTV